MPRTARFIEPGGYYHIISRSINDEWILKEREDFFKFKSITMESKEKYKLQLFHYVLMNNHFHFVLQTPSKDALAEGIQRIKSRYSRWFRNKYGWKGPIWRERYKSLWIEDERYLSACGFYIEMNPVRAGICAEPSDYEFSSFRKYHAPNHDALVDTLLGTVPVGTVPK
jgi:putative transposase